MKNFAKGLLCLLFISFYSFQSFGQSESSFGAFLASPVGKFKSTDIEEGGFAKSGWGIVFDSKRELPFLPEGWSMYSHSTYQWNKMDTERISEEFTKILGANTVVSESRYSPILTTLGPAYDYIINDQLTFGINAGIGIMFNNTKAFTVKVFDENDNEIVSELVNFDNHVAFAYMGGAELNYEVYPDLITITLFLNYTGASQKTDLSFTTADPVDSFQQLQYLNTGFRIALKKQ